MRCINIKHKDFVNLQSQTGLSTFQLELAILRWQAQVGNTEAWPTVTDIQANQDLPKIGESLQLSWDPILAVNNIIDAVKAQNKPNEPLSASEDIDIQQTGDNGLNQGKEAITGSSGREFIENAIISSITRIEPTMEGRFVVDTELDAPGKVIEKDGMYVLSFNPTHSDVLQSDRPVGVVLESAVLANGDETDAYKYFNISPSRLSKLMLRKDVYKEDFDTPLRKRVRNEIPKTSDRPNMRQTKREIEDGFDELDRDMDFDPLTHTAVNKETGERYGSMSEGKGMMGYGFDPEKMSDAAKANMSAAAVRGTLVHQVLENALISGIVREEDLDVADGTLSANMSRETAEKLVKLVRRGLEAEGIDLSQCEVWTEKIISSEQYKTFGIIDLFLLDKRTGKKYLLDYKTKAKNTGFVNYNVPSYLTPSQRSGYDLQSAVYTIIMNDGGIPVDARGCILIEVDQEGDTILDVGLDKVYTKNGIDWFRTVPGEQMHSDDRALLMNVRASKRNTIEGSLDETISKKLSGEMRAFAEDTIKRIKASISFMQQIKHITRDNKTIQNAVDRLNELQRQIQKGDPKMALTNLINVIQADLFEAQTFLKNVELDAGQHMDENTVNIIEEMVSRNNNLVENLQALLETGGSEVDKAFGDIKGFWLDHLDSITRDLASVYKTNTNIKNRYTEWRVRNNAKQAGVNHLIDSFNWEQTDRDIGQMFRLFGSLKNSPDSLSKAIHYMVVNGIRQTQLDTMRKGVPFLKLFEAARKTGKLDMKDFFETDADGKWTGNFVSSMVVSRAVKATNDFLANLYEKYGLGENAEMWLPNAEDNAKMFDEWNTWLDENTERYFTRAFYDLKDKLVSPMARRARASIAAAERNILSKGYANLTEKDKVALVDLRLQKRELASEYDRFGEPKHGTELDIAKQWASFNEAFAKLMAKKFNYEAFEKARKAVQEDPDVTEEEYQHWLDTNTQTIWPEEWSEELANIEKRWMGPNAKAEFDEVNKQLKAIIKIYTDSSTGNIMWDLIPEVVSLRVKDLESELARIKEETTIPGDTVGSLRFKDVATIDKSAFVKKSEQMKRKYGEKSVEYRTWFENNVLTDENGNVIYDHNTGEAIPLRIWTKLVPADQKKYPPKIEPSNDWAEDSEDSPILNKNYKGAQDDRFYQFKESKWGVNNFKDLKDKWDKINSVPEIKAFYEEMISMMKDAESMIPFLHREGLLRMPQIRSTPMERIKQSNGTLKAILREVKNTFVTRVDDDQWSVDFMKSGVSGTRSMSIPTWYIKPLENMEELTTDLASSVLQFYQMASNFSNMSKIRSDVDLIMDRMAKREVRKNPKSNKTKTGTESNVYDHTMKFLESTLFGQAAEKLEFNVGNNTFNATKAADAFLGYTRAIGLGFNVFTAFANWGSSTANTLVESTLGRYFDTNSYKFAIKEMAANIVQSTSDYKANTMKGKITAMMDTFGIMGSVKRKVQNAGYSQTSRVAVPETAIYFPYEMGDFSTKGAVAIAIMHNYRLFDGKFVSKRAFFDNIYLDLLRKREPFVLDKKEYKVVDGVTTRDGKPIDRKLYEGLLRKYSKKIGKSRWDNLTVTAWDAFENKGGLFQPKVEYKNIINDALTVNIINEISHIATDIDNQLGPTDKAPVHRTIAGKFLTLYRNWLTNMIQYRFKPRGENHILGTMDEGQYRVTGKFVKNFIGELFTGSEKLLALYNQWNMLEDWEQRMVKKTGMELVTIGLMLGTIALLTLLMGGEPPEEDDNWLISGGRYAMVRTLSELIAPYNPAEIWTLMSSPTAAKSVIGDIAGIYKLFVPGDEIERGPFKGWNPQAKQAISLTPFKNILRIQHPEDMYPFMVRNIGFPNL